MLLDNRDPFYAPLWRRILIVGFCLGWAAFELWNGATFWAAAFGGVGLFALWKLFVTFPNDGNGPAGDG
jgi:hypothetical protein